MHKSQGGKTSETAIWSEVLALVENQNCSSGVRSTRNKLVLEPFNGAPAGGNHPPRTAAASLVPASVAP
eukprot:7796629-Lingulodinium_polyedra.AAC.1